MAARIMLLIVSLNPVAKCIRVHLNPKQTYLFKDLCEEIIIRSPKMVGSLGPRQRKQPGHDHVVGFSYVESAITKPAYIRRQTDRQPDRQICRYMGR